MTGNMVHPRDQDGNVGAGAEDAVLYPEVPVLAYPVLMNRTCRFTRDKMRRKQGVGFTGQRKGTSCMGACEDSGMTLPPQENTLLSHTCLKFSLQQQTTWT